MPVQKPFVLLILDGWGYREESRDNAIMAARTPQWDRWWAQYPHTLLEASGAAVGLPEGQMGNSEVGHMHIGAGRVIPQDFTRINEAIRSGAFDENPVLHEAIRSLKASGKALHVMGLLSDGGVHSHEAHLFTFLALCQREGFSNIFLHLFLDGRDTPPQSAQQSLARLDSALKKYPVATIASVTGRYYAMDRDNRWARLEPVYRMLTGDGCTHHFDTAEAAVRTFAEQGITDEFVPPCMIGDAPALQNGDGVFLFNFRADRVRQLTRALTDEAFTGFERHSQPALSCVLTMTRYARDLQTEVVFPPMLLRNTLGEILAVNDLRQLRLAETEKYAHVTWFFNGGSEQVFPEEDRILVPSPHVATYDEKPEMSAPELTRILVDAIKSRDHDIIICNYANADMVGHTGNLAATIQAIEALDDAFHAIGEALETAGGTMLITADHGNAEKMFDPATQQAHTAHTIAPVPLLFVGQGWHFSSVHGTLADVAPTILALLGIDKPADMSGHSLMVPDDPGHTA